MLIFTLTFLATTPATIFDYTNFMAGLSYEISHYASGHDGHTVRPGLRHGWKMLIYFSSVVFSNSYLIALTIFGLSLIGFVDMLRKSGAASLIFLSFPALYGSYFSFQRAMVVRNLLVLVPFFAIASGRGATVAWSWLSDALSRRRATMRCFANATVVGAIGLFLSYNACWLCYSAQTIRDRHTDRFLREFVKFASRESPKQFFISAKVRLQLSDMGALSALPITNDPKTADAVVLYANEGLEDWRRWPANQPWMTRWFGPNEVNFNMYPNWWGDDRIIVMPMSNARHLNLIILRSP
jgi:hypothetical protein